MDTNLQQEVKDTILRDVAGGFVEDEQEMFDNITDMFYGETLDEAWVKQEIAVQFAAKLKEQATWPEETDVDRLMAAFDELNEQGIIALHNAGYTRQDGESDVWDLHHQLKEDGVDSIGYCFYHAQDLERVIDGQQLYLAFGAFEAGDAAGIAVGEAVFTMLEQYEFQPVWDHSLDNRIAVPGIKWQKRILQDIG